MTLPGEIYYVNTNTNPKLQEHRSPSAILEELAASQSCVEIKDLKQRMPLTPSHQQQFKNDLFVEANH